MWGKWKTRASDTIDLDYPQTEHIDWQDKEFNEADVIREPKGTSTGGQFASQEGGGGVAGGETPGEAGPAGGTSKSYDPPPDSVISTTANVAHEMAETGSSAETIETYLNENIEMGLFGENDPAVKYVKSLIKQVGANESGVKGGTETEPASADFSQTKSAAPAPVESTPSLASKETTAGFYASGTSSDELVAASKSPAKLEKLAADSHKLGISLNKVNATIKYAKPQIGMWTSKPGYQNLNNQLNGTKTDTSMAIYADTLQEAILSNKLPESVNVYRGVHGPQGDIVKGMQPGDVWANSGFQATTLDPKRATHYAQGGDMIHMVLPKGSPGLYVSDPAINGWENEHELTMPAGSTMKLISSEKVMMPQYDYSGNLVSDELKEVTLHHMQVLQPGDPEFESAHPRDENGQFMKKPGTYAMGMSDIEEPEEEEFNGGDFDPDPDDAPDYKYTKPEGNASYSIAASDLHEMAEQGHTASELEDYYEKEKSGMSVAAQDYAENLISEVATEHFKTGTPAPTPAADPTAIPPLPGSLGTSKIAYYAHKKATSQGYTAADLEQFIANASGPIGGQKASPEGIAYAKSVLAALKAKEAAASPPPAATMIPISGIPGVPSSLTASKTANKAYEHAAHGLSSKEIGEWIEKTKADNAYDDYDAHVKYANLVKNAVAAHEKAEAAKSAPVAPSPNDPTVIDDVPQYVLNSAHADIGNFAHSLAKSTFLPPDKVAEAVASYQKQKVDNGELDKSDATYHYINQLKQQLAMKGGAAKPAAPAAPPIPMIPAAVSNGDYSEYSKAKALENAAHAGEDWNILQDQVSEWADQNDIDYDGPAYKYMQSLIQAVKAQEAAVLGGKAAPQGPAAYPTHAAPLTLPEPPDIKFPEGDAADDEINRIWQHLQPEDEDGDEQEPANVDYVQKQMNKLLKHKTIEPGGAAHQYLRKLISTMNAIKYQASNKAQQPELFADPATPAPEPPKAAKLGTGNDEDYGRSDGKAPKVSKVYESKSKRTVELGNKLRTNATKTDTAGSYAAKRAAPSVDRDWWDDEATYEERASCKTFMEGSGEINGFLRGSGGSYVSDETREHVDNIDALYENDNTKVTQDLRVFRGQSTPKSKIDAIKDMLERGVPARAPIEGFMSTSIADHVYGTFKGDTYMNITVREGTRAVGIYGIAQGTGFEGENELLLRHGSMLEYYAVHEHENGDHTLFAYTVT